MGIGDWGIGDWAQSPIPKSFNNKENKNKLFIY
jgi:hypothetical protein